MIKVNDRFEFEKGQHDWQLHETTPSKDKDGNPSTKRKTTYHANIAQIGRTIIDRSCGDCESIQELNQLLANAGAMLIDRLETKMIDAATEKPEATKYLSEEEMWDFVNEREAQG